VIRAIQVQGRGSVRVATGYYVHQQIQRRLITGLALGLI
jgi:hypothetical protein